MSETSQSEPQHHEGFIVTRSRPEVASSGDYERPAYLVDSEVRSMAGALLEEKAQDFIESGDDPNSFNITDMREAVRLLGEVEETSEKSAYGVITDTIEQMRASGNTKDREIKKKIRVYGTAQRALEEVNNLLIEEALEAKDAAVETGDYAAYEEEFTIDALNRVISDHNQRAARLRRNRKVNTSDPGESNGSESKARSRGMSEEQFAEAKRIIDNMNTSSNRSSETKTADTLVPEDYQERRKFADGYFSPENLDTEDPKNIAVMRRYLELEIKSALKGAKEAQLKHGEQVRYPGRVETFTQTLFDIPESGPARFLLDVALKKGEGNIKTLDDFRGTKLRDVASHVGLNVYDVEPNYDRYFS